MVHIGSAWNVALLCSALCETTLAIGPFRVPFQLEGHLIVVQVEIPPLKGLKFALDTGCSVTTVSPRVAAKLHLKGERTDVVSWGETVSVRRILVPYFRIGSAEFRDIETQIATLPPAGDVRLDGLIGISLLRHGCWTIDFEAGQLTLGSDERRLGNTQHFYPKLPMILLSVNIGGKSVRLLLDTGTLGLVLYKKSGVPLRKTRRQREVKPSPGGFLHLEPILLDYFQWGESVWQQLPAYLLQRDSRDSKVAGNLGIAVLGVRVFRLDVKNGVVEWAR